MLPEFQTFLNDTNQAQLWDNIKWFMFYIAPIIMITFAFSVVGYLVQVIKSFFTKEDPANEDNDYDVYRY